MSMHPSRQAYVAESGHGDDDDDDGDAMDGIDYASVRAFPVLRLYTARS